MGHTDEHETPPPSIARAAQLLGWGLLRNVSALDRGHVKPSALSPVSIVIAAAMLAGGADSERQAEWCRKLGVVESISADIAVMRASAGASAGNDILSVANAVFVDKTVELHPGYADFLASIEALIQQYPSLSDAVLEINTWISQNTLGRINNMLSTQALRNAHVVLVNAVAFRGTWKTKFDTAKTVRNHPFFLEDGSKSFVDMMFLHGKDVETSQCDGYTAVRLHYATGSTPASTSLTAFIPKQGITLRNIVEDVQSRPRPSFQRKKYTRLGFPKFKVESKFSLLNELNALGFPVRGSYPAMCTGPSEVSAVIHQAFVNVDEEGTEAAAATAIIMKRSRSAVAQQEILVFDRPFLYSINAGEDGIPIICGAFTASQ